MTGRQRHRARLAKRRRIAAYARLVMAVHERRRLADAELRDLVVVQPDDAARVRLLYELARKRLVRWEDAGLVIATRPGLWEAEAKTPCDRCGGPCATYLRGCPAGEVDGGRQLALPLAATDGRDAP